MIRHKKGRGWEYDSDGYILVEHYDGRPRTSGEPETMRTMRRDFREAIDSASRRFDIAPQVIMAVIALESVPVRGTHHRDPRSRRVEPSGAVSVGLMQTLTTTAEQINRRYHLGLDVSESGLRNATTSIMVGTCYLAHLAKRNRTNDGVLLQAAFNAGGVYLSMKNEWHLRTYGPDRTMRFCRWHNDALSVLRGDA